MLAIVAGMASMTTGVVGGRELFGYSFSTWRVHLRGENICSEHDVGQVRNLTVGKMCVPMCERPANA
jgi:chloride channel protein, CIC family